MSTKVKAWQSYFPVSIVVIMYNPAGTNKWLDLEGSLYWWSSVANLISSVVATNCHLPCGLHPSPLQTSLVFGQAPGAWRSIQSLFTHHTACSLLRSRCAAAATAPPPTPPLAHHPHRSSPSQSQPRSLVFQPSAVLTMGKEPHWINLEWRLLLKCMERNMWWNS